MYLHAEEFGFDFSKEGRSFRVVIRRSNNSLRHAWIFGSPDRRISASEPLWGEVAQMVGVAA